LLVGERQRVIQILENHQKKKDEEHKRWSEEVDRSCQKVGRFKDWIKIALGVD
jgi:hypothetical protein